MTAYVTRKLTTLMVLVVALMSLFPSTTAQAATMGNYWEEIPNILWDGEEIPKTETWSGSSIKAMAPMEKKIVKKYYEQPTFAVKEGYDAISAFITSNDSSEIYEGKIYFVVSGNEWLLYNYKPEIAEKYFLETENFNGMQIPKVISDIHEDDPNTISMDEAKIPLIARKDFNGMFCNWRSLDELPFTRDASGNYIYATYEVAEDEPEQPGDEKEPQDPEKEEPEKETPSENQPGTPSGNQPEKTTPTWSSNTDAYWYRYTVSVDSTEGAFIRTNTYRIFVTRTVSYNGKKHALSGSKEGKKKTADIEVIVFLNGEQVDPKLYGVTFKNNLYCNGFGGLRNVETNGQKSGYVPEFKLKFKFKNKALKQDKKAFRNKYFKFNISPIDLSTGEVTHSGVTKTGLKKPVFKTAEGAEIKMRTSAKKGDYSLTWSGDQLLLSGMNNFTGTVVIPTTGGGDVY